MTSPVTSALADALRLQNEVTLAALRKGGHITAKQEKAIRTGAPVLDVRRGAALPGDYPFTHDLGFARVAAAMGRSLVGVDVARPIVWPDMKKVEEQVRAARAPMSDATKEHLRSLAAAKPRNIGDEVARQLQAAGSNRLTLARLLKDSLKLPEDPKEIMEKYAHLDNGRYRMTIGNRMRAKWRADNLNAKTRGTGINAGLKPAAVSAALQGKPEAPAPGVKAGDERPSRICAPNAPSPRVPTKGGKNAKGSKTLRVKVEQAGADRPVANASAPDHTGRGHAAPEEKRSGRVVQKRAKSKPGRR